MFSLCSWLSRERQISVRPCLSSRTPEIYASSHQQDIDLHAFSELPLIARRPIFCRKTVQITSPLRIIPAHYYDISPVCLLSNPSSLNGVFLDVVGSHPNLPKMSVVPWPRETSRTSLMPLLLLDPVRFPKQRISSANTVPTELRVNKMDL